MLAQAASFTQQIIQMLTNPVGLAVLFVGVLVGLIFVVSDWGRWVAMALAIYFVTIYRDDTNEFFDLTFSGPLKYLSQYCRYIFMGLLACMVLSRLRLPQDWRKHYISSIVVMLFIFQLAYAIRLMMSGVWLEKGILSIIVYTLIFSAFGLTMPLMLRKYEDIDKLLKCFVIVCILIILGTVHQMIFNKVAVLPKGRMFGTLPNPQTAAILFAFGIIILSYQMFTAGAKVKNKLFLPGLIAVFTIFLFWTGSRTGIVLTLFGLVMLFRARLGQFSIYIILVGAMVLIGLNFTNDDFGQSIERLSSTQDTRSVIWRSLIQDFSAQPLIGVMDQDLRIGESTYLTALAQMGIIGGILMLAIVGAIAKTILKLFKIRKAMPEQIPLIDFVVAILTMFIVVGFMESIFFGVFAFPILLLFNVSAISSYIIDGYQYTLRHQTAL